MYHVRAHQGATWHHHQETLVTVRYRPPRPVPSPYARQHTRQGPTVCRIPTEQPAPDSPSGSHTVAAPPPLAGPRRAGTPHKLDPLPPPPPHGHAILHQLSTRGGGEGEEPRRQPTREALPWRLQPAMTARERRSGGAAATRVARDFLVAITMTLWLQRCRKVWHRARFTPCQRLVGPRWQKAPLGPVCFFIMVFL